MHNVRRIRDESERTNTYIHSFAYIHRYRRIAIAFHSHQTATRTTTKMSDEHRLTANGFGSAVREATMRLKLSMYCFVVDSFGVAVVVVAVAVTVRHCLFSFYFIFIFVFLLFIRCISEAVVYCAPSLSCTLAEIVQPIGSECLHFFIFYAAQCCFAPLSPSLSLAFAL